MDTTYPHAKQRAALLKLVSALGCREAALRRDECGDWRIGGSNGHIFAVPGTLDHPNRPGFMLYVMTASPKARSIADLAGIVRELEAKGAALRAIEPPIDTSTAAGRPDSDRRRPLLRR